MKTRVGYHSFGAEVCVQRRFDIETFPYRRLAPFFCAETVLALFILKLRGFGDESFCGPEISVPKYFGENYSFSKLWI